MNKRAMNSGLMVGAALLLSAVASPAGIADGDQEPDEICYAAGDFIVFPDAVDYIGDTDDFALLLGGGFVANGDKGQFGWFGLAPLVIGPPPASEAPDTEGDGTFGYYVTGTYEGICENGIGH